MADNTPTRVDIYVNQTVDAGSGSSANIPSGMAFSFTENTLTVSAGTVRSAVKFELKDAFHKQVEAWSVGDYGGLLLDTIAEDYTGKLYVFAIKKGSNTDIGASLTETPTLPTGYTDYAKLGYILLKNEAIDSVHPTKDLANTFLDKDYAEPATTLAGYGITDAYTKDESDANLQTHTERTDNPHTVTKDQVGLGNVDNTSDLDKPISTATQSALDLKADGTDLTTHINDVNNPHSVTKAQVGLGQVDNTADIDKPVSTAQRAAIDAHANRTDNPHNVTKEQVGLGNVDNTSDADKPISTATQSALDDINARLNSVFHYRGSVETYADLPTENVFEGDVYNVVQADPEHGIDAGDNVVWVVDSSEESGVAGYWDVLGGIVDLSGKQDLLVSGVNIKTINGDSLLESGDLVINTYNSFPETWPTTSNDSFDDFLKAVFEYEDAKPGMAYLGELHVTGKPMSGNVATVVEVQQGPSSSSKALHVIITSGTDAPYRWEYTAWNYSEQNNTYSKSDWIGSQPELKAGANVTLTNITENGQKKVQIETHDTTYTAGGGIEIESGEISVTSDVLRNTSTDSSSLSVLGTSTAMVNAINIGVGSRAGSNFTTAIGSESNADLGYSVAIGYYSKNEGRFATTVGAQATATDSAHDSIAIGRRAKTSARNAIQLGPGQNSTDKTLKVSFQETEIGTSTYDDTVNYTLLNSDGKVPTERLIVDGETVVNNNGVLSAANQVPEDNYTASNLLPGKYIDITEESGESGEIVNTISVDDKVYTQDNLIAGNNISLTDKLDTDALLLLHFDDNFNDSSSYNVEAKGYTSGGAETTLTGTFIDAKFGKGLKTTNVYARYYHNKKELIASKKEATIEFWIKKVNITSSAYMTCSSGSSLHWTISGDTLSFYYIPFTNDYYGKQDIDISSVNSDSFFHVAFTYKSGIITIYIDGVSKWTRDFSTFWDYYFDASRIRDYVEILGAGTDDGVIDEFRFSDIARYSGDKFDVPTEQFTTIIPGVKSINNTMPSPSVMTGATSGTAGTSGLVPAPAAGDQVKFLKGDGTWATLPIDGTTIVENNGVISAVSSVPDNVYTQDNLVAGTNITLVTETIDKGIDEHTIEVFHCDTAAQSSNTGVLGNASLTKSAYDTISLVDGHFDKGWKGTSNRLEALRLEGVTISTNNAYTMDWWHNSQVSYNNTYQLYDDNRITLLETAISGDYRGLQLEIYDSSEVKQTYTFENAEPINTWVHFAIENDPVNQKVYLFVNGEKLADISINIFKQTVYPVFYAISSSVDEIRISNNVRWTSRFKPFTEPYAQSVTAKTINSTNSVQSQSVTNIITCTQSEYDMWVQGGTVSATTFYAIIPEESGESAV